MADAVTVPARRGLRSDAEENRQRLLAAAVTAIQREGSHVPLATIAAEAKVGVGTLYRHYPDRDALFEGLAIRSYGLVIDVLHEVLDAGESGIDGIDQFLRRTIAHRDQLVLPYHGAPKIRSVEAERLRRHLAHLMGDVLERGRRDGSIRPDVRPQDVIIFGAILAQPLPNVDGWDAVAVAQKDYFLRGIRP